MIKNQLNLCLVQTDLIWMDAEANLNYLEKQLQNLETDLIVLPEMFNTGFSMQPEFTSEKMNGKSITWLKQMAKKLCTAICGSLAIEENKKYFNRFVFVYPDETLQYYNKKHLFSLCKENHFFEAGKQQVSINYKGFKINPFVCYDLRFPVWNRNSNNYDLALYVANWPAKRAHAWNSLLMARAIENMCYVVAVNRVGIDGNKLRYQGDSKVLSPLGDVIIDCKDQLTIHQLTLDKKKVTEARSRFKFLDDNDHFKIL